MVIDVKKITYEDTKPFILEVHYARRLPCIQYAYGLFIDNTMIGVVTYGQPASPALCKGIAGEENRKNVLELNRLVILPEYNGGNYTSILVSKSLKLLPKHKIIVSYADIGGWGHTGYIYQACNFLYTGMTKARTDKYGGKNGHPRHYKKDETRRQIRTAKYRYVTFTGDKRDKKQLLKQLKYPVINEYPKGNNIEYDTSNPIPVNRNIGKVIGG